mmetsp:Transcript_61557/g.179910  ORF Transcript_61557/g.179910 Transcript_61557/m.179910 type:complete len:252 (+) Transcript_61557:75-830(+)
MGFGGDSKGGRSEFTVQHPEKTVWLGSLPEGTTHTDLLPMMKSVGDCKRVQVGTKGTGFAFFSSPEEATAAIEQLNGAVLNGTAIQVDVYAKKPGSGGGGKGKNSWSNSTPGVWKPQFQKSMEGGKGWGNSWNSKGDSGGGGWSAKGGNSWGNDKGGWGGGKAGGKGGKFDFKVAHPDRTVWIGNLAEDTTHEDLMPLFQTVGDCKRVQVGRKGTGFAFFADAEAAQTAILTLNGAVVKGSEIQVDTYNKK